ncbi:MAG: hypothetical protein KatS3mg115_1715 [Candidatus Poribacteria bacterium]|nr:MAG: hypothetical protein KatS3mg115_1715 [Candidatus Poribacteria bacterium]
MEGRLRTALADYFTGLAGGLLLGGAAWAIGEYGLRQLARGPWSAALMSILAIALLCTGVVIGVGEPLYRRARSRWGQEIPRLRSKVYEAAFLGSPAVIALLSLIEMDWNAIMFGGQLSLPVRLLLILLGLVQYVVTAPVRALLGLGVPAEVLILLAMPLGAVLALHVAPLRRELLQSHEPDLS